MSVPPALEVLVLRFRSLFTRSSASALTVLLALCILAGVWGCRKSGEADEALATVNGKKILRSEVDKYYKNQTANSPAQPEAEQADSLKLQIVRQLIDDEIMMQRAAKLNLNASDEEIDSKLNELKAPYTKEEFDKRLKDKNLTVEDLKNELRRNETVQKVLNKEINSKINISDKDISDYYNAHKAEFNLIEPQYHLARILVTNQPNPNIRNLKNSKAQNDGEAKKKVEQLHSNLESNEDFATVAMNYSEDPDTASNGGDMGFWPESALKQQGGPGQSIMNLQPGQMSGVLPVLGPGKVTTGYQIIKLIAKEQAGQREITDPRVQQNIREQLRQRREQLLKAAYYEALHNDARIENYLAENILKNPSK
jgi:peptidyl-prolyl cis-trans isomerase SurA